VGKIKKKPSIEFTFYNNKKMIKILPGNNTGVYQTQYQHTTQAVLTAYRHCAK